MGIWTAVVEEIYERLQQRPLNRRTVWVKNGDNSTQSVTLAINKSCFEFSKAVVLPL